MTGLLLRNAVLWSGGRSLTGDTLGIVDGRIAAIGTEDAVREQLPAGHDVLDAEGGLVTAGFADSHIHLGLVAVDSIQCDLAGAATLDELESRIRAFAARSTAPWISGGGWALDLFEGGSPTATLLDTLVPDRPALLLDADHHGAWANTLALRAAGIDASTPDPADGRIDRDADGNPSGMLNEGAVQLVARVMPDPDPRTLADAIVEASRRVLAVGITGWQEAALGHYGGVPDFTTAYLDALGRGLLRGRPTGAIWMPRDLQADGVGAFVERALSAAAANEAAGFPTRTVKVMLDGIVETQTAALREPYHSAAGGTGLSYFTPELLRVAIPAINAAGLAVHVHAIGDRAVGDALDAFEAVPAAVRSTVRNHIAHLQVIAEEDVPRFAALGVTANLQPLWAANGPVVEQFTVPLLGADRARRLYVFGSLLRSGASLAGGSDWPVSDFDPWQGIHVAVNRRSPGDTTSAPLNPDEALPLEVAVDAYTRGSHELLFGPGTGVLEVGAPADLAVANRDPFAGPPEDIHLTRTVATLIGGVPV